MTELEIVDNSDNFSFRGWGFHRFCKSARNALRQRGKNEMFAQLWLCYISIAKVWMSAYQYFM